MPNETVQFLSLDEVIAIHERLIDCFGGSPGLRDKGLLESALYRARSGYYESLDTIATAMLESLLINQPFIDGNKQVAFFATDVFLRMNGWKFSLKPDAAFAFLMERFETQTLNFDQLSAWIRNSIVKL